MNSSKIKSGYRSAYLSLLLSAALMLVVSIIGSTAISVYATMQTQSADINVVTEVATEIQSKYVMVTNAVVYIIADLLPVFIFMKASKNKGKLKNWFGKSKISFGMTALLSFTTLAVATLDSILILIFQHFFGTSGVTEQLGVSLLSDNKVILVITLLYVCIVGPVMEEILFRGFILHETACVSPIFGIIISATLFGLFHMNFEQAINATILGILFGYIALKANSIKPTIALHIINNTFSCVITIITEKYGISDTVNGVLTIAILLIGILGFILLIKKNGAVKRNEDMIDSDIFVTDEEIADIKERENKGNLGIGLALTQVSFYLTYIVMIALCILVQFAV